MAWRECCDPLRFDSGPVGGVAVLSGDSPRIECSAIPQAWASRSGDLALPRFKLAERSELLPTLAGLGLDKGLHSPSALAEFGAGAVLSQVVQRAMIEVDEEGAEAARRFPVSSMAYRTGITDRRNKQVDSARGRDGGLRLSSASFLFCS